MLTKMNLMDKKKSVFMFYYKGKKYYNVNEWTKNFNECYGWLGIKIEPKHIHHLFRHYKLEPIKTNSNYEVSKDGKIYWFREASVNSVRYTNDFVETLYNIVVYGDSRGKEALYNVVDDDVVDFNDNIENDMEKYSEYLINNVYQESERVIKNVLNEWFKKNVIPTYKDDDKLELVKDKNVVNGGNFPIKRNGKEYWGTKSPI